MNQQTRQATHTQSHGTNLRNNVQGTLATNIHHTYIIKDTVTVTRTASSEYFMNRLLEANN